MGDQIEIRTVTDFLAIPTDKREHCLKDFAMWVTLTSEAAETFGDIGGVMIQTDKFIWIDDGKHDVHLSVVIGTGKEP